MSTLRISLLGMFHIHHDGWSVETKICRATRSLLAYLVLFRERIHAREVLAGLFWGDHSEDRARSCLSTALWRLRKVLEPRGIPKGTYLVAPSSGEIAFNQESNHWIDVAIFEKQTRKILARPYQLLKDSDVRELENTLKLYTGDLLEGFYDEWALSERERLRSLYLKSQAHLLSCYCHNGAYEQALACGQNILNFDPLREEIHREMMRLYMVNGQRPMAMRQYETCCKVLETELCVSPMEETQALHQRIIRRLNQDQNLSRSCEDTLTAHQALQQLHQTLQNLNTATEQLQQATRLLEEAIKH